MGDMMQKFVVDTGENTALLSCAARRMRRYDGK